MKYGILTRLFLAGNLIYGAGFALFGWYGGVVNSSLYQSLSGLYTWLPHIWGTGLVLAVVLVALAGRLDRWYTRTAGAALGFAAWVFASLIYLQTGYVLVFFSVGLLYLGFWIYYYFMYVSSLNNQE